jgi:hypothetical protein
MIRSGAFLVALSQVAMRLRNGQVLVAWNVTAIFSLPVPVRRRVLRRFRLQGSISASRLPSKTCSGRVSTGTQAGGGQERQNWDVGS